MAYRRTTLAILINLLLSGQVLAADEPDEKTSLSVAAQALLEKANQSITHIDTATLNVLLKKHPETLVIDIREPDELVAMGGYISAPNVFNIPRGYLELEIDARAPDKTTPIVVYCNVGNRSPFAADTLTKLGYTQVKNYTDGFNKWKRADLPVKFADKAPDSFLYSKPQEIIPGVWSAIGATAPATYDNSGHNNNLSFVITEDGVLVMNAGANYLLAQTLHEEIKKLTQQPVKYVVLENSQGHAMLGSNYWRGQGATIIAHRDAAHEIEKEGANILQSMRTRLRDKAFKTTVLMPDKIIGDKFELTMGSWKFEVLHLGSAHSPGDLMVWIPEKKLVISGDIAFHERLLAFSDTTNTAAWITTWDKFSALGAQYVIPGHGGPTQMAEVTQYTRDYLVYMRQEMAKVISQGGTLLDAYKIDQSAYAHLDTFHELARINAGLLFRAMEFE